MDVDGNGTADVVNFSPGHTRYYPNTGAGQFERPRFLGGDFPLDFDIQDPDTALADINGDGRVDLIKTSGQGLVAWHNRGGEKGFDFPTVVKRTNDRNELPDVRISDPSVFLTDMTGDGLPDIVHIKSGLVEYWPSLGGGYYDTRQVMERAPVLPDNYDPQRIFFADIDGTGASDVIYVGHAKVEYWRNLGGLRFTDSATISGTPDTLIDTVRLADIDGRGTLGILWSGVRAGRRSGYRYLSLIKDKPYLLTHIREATGLETEIIYSTSCQDAIRDVEEGIAWQTQLPIPVQVVRQIIQRDLVTGNEDRSEIFYHEGRWDPMTRRFRGFGRVTVGRIGGVDAQEAYEEYHYLVGSPGEPSIAGSSGLQSVQLDRARRGQNFLISYLSRGPSSAPIRKEETNWEVSPVAESPTGTSILFCQVASTVAWNIEMGDHPRVVRNEYTYDEYGNVIQEVKSGFAPNGDDEGNPRQILTVITSLEYAYNTERYIVDRVAKTIRKDDANAIFTEVRQYYDGPDFQGLSLGNLTRGLLSRQEEIVMTVSEATGFYGANEPDWLSLGYHQVLRTDTTPCWAVNQTRYTHTVNGMIAQRLDPLGATTTFQYGPDGLLVEHMTNAEGHIRTATWDRSWQLIDSHSSATGATTHYHYDGLGRLRAVIRPGDTKDFPTIIYTHNHTSLPNSIRIVRRKDAGTNEVYQKIKYFDAYGRIIQQRSGINDDKVRVSGVVSLNARGEAISKGQPLFRNGFDFEPPNSLPTTSQFEYQYDALGRVIRSKNPDNKEIQVEYTPWTSTLYDVIDTDQNHPHYDTPRIQFFDVFGRLSRVKLLANNQTAHSCSYDYDFLGRLVASTDLEGRPAVRSIRYDNRGLKWQIDHATAGVRSMIYDAAGRLVRYWDGRGIPVERIFDPIGRIRSESINGVIQEQYHYDEKPDQLGKLSRVTDLAGTVHFEYDERGRVSQKTRTINGKTYQIGYGYDSSGLQRQIAFPNGAVVDFDRWGDGRVRSVSQLIDEIDFESTGRLSKISHSNGVEENYTYDSSGYLLTQKMMLGNQHLFDARLTHNAAGHLTRWEEHAAGVQPQVESYERDSLGRLIQFNRDEGGSQVQWQYAYDADGNLMKAEEMDATQYHYDFSAIGGMTARDKADGSVEHFSFDAAGHLTAMEGISYEFDPRGHMIRATKDDGTVIEMTYDYRGARVAKRVNGPTGAYEVRYVDEIYEDHGAIETAYVFVTGRLVGYFRGGGKRYLHTDHRGSIVAVTRSDGTVDSRAWFGPYGQAAILTNSEDSRQFTGAVLDRETGLYYFNLRYYSPDLGRFISADPRYLGQPEKEIDFPEVHNLYAYANNNPIDYTDPSGMGFWSSLGKVLAGIVVAIAVIAAVVVVVALIASAGGLMLTGAAIGALIGGISDGWQGAAIGAMMGATIGINIGIGGPLGIITFLGVFKGIRKQDWYKSLAGWTSWLMPASWPGHIMGLGVFLGNGIAHIFGSDKQIESMKFDWKHGQILTAGGEYGGNPFPWLGFEGPAHNVGGFSFWSNDTWEEGGKTWEGIENTVNSGRGFDHETGHMLSNALFGFWQGVINGIENLTVDNHDDRFFEKIAQSNVDEGDRNSDDQVVPFWN